MEASSLIGIAAMILLLLPPVVLAWERKPIPDACHAAIAVGGAAMAAARGGWPGMAGAIGIGILCLLLVGMAVTTMRRLWAIHILSGGHIKLLGAGAVWLGAWGATLMVTLAVAGFLAAAALLHVRGTTRVRPEFIPIAGAVMLAVALQQALLPYP